MGVLIYVGACDRVNHHVRGVGIRVSSKVGDVVGISACSCACVLVFACIMGMRVIIYVLMRSRE